MADFDSDPGAPSPSAPNAPHASHAPGATGSEPILQTLHSLWRDLTGLLSDRIDLLTLELQRAGAALVQICVLVIAAAILGVTAWLVLWASIAAGVIALGVPLAGALLIVFVVNLVAAWLAVGRARKLLLMVSLPATRRHLMHSSATFTSPPPPTPPSRTGHDPNDFVPARQTAAR